jgi:hypothetical protein
VDTGAVPDDVEKSKFLTLPGLELRPLGRPARSQSLYRLHYPGSYDLWSLYCNIPNIRFEYWTCIIKSTTT